MPDKPAVQGRRERKRAATQTSIFDAARSLFQERPFEEVTVQEIADRADIGVGTLFYYAPNKTDLFLMVYNVVLGQAIAAGEETERSLPDNAPTLDRIMALITPIARLTQHSQVRNLTRYHRDLLFGDSVGPHQKKGIDLVRHLEKNLAHILCGILRFDPDSDISHSAAQAIFATLHFSIAAPRNEEYPLSTDSLKRESTLRMQVDMVVRGFISRAYDQGLLESVNG